MNDTNNEYREEKADDIVLTREGHAKLAEELDHLKNVKRWEVAKRLEEARAHGDITENSEYEDAKHEQAFVAGRIIDIERVLDNARIINEGDIKTGVVSLGITWSCATWRETRRRPTAWSARPKRAAAAPASPTRARWVKPSWGARKGESGESPHPGR